MAEAVREKRSKTKAKVKKQKERQSYEEQCEDVSETTVQDELRPVSSVSKLKTAEEDIEDAASTSQSESQQSTHSDERKHLTELRDNENLSKYGTKLDTCDEKIEQPKEAVDSDKKHEESVTNLPVHPESELTESHQIDVKESDVVNSETCVSDTGTANVEDDNVTRSESFHSALSSLTSEGNDTKEFSDKVLNIIQESTAEKHLEDLESTSEKHSKYFEEVVDNERKSKHSKDSKDVESAANKHKDSEDLIEYKSKPETSSGEVEDMVSGTDTLQNTLPSSEKLQEPSSDKSETTVKNELDAQQSDKLYPVLDKFLDGSTVKSDTLETIACSVGKTHQRENVPKSKFPEAFAPTVGSQSNFTVRQTVGKMGHVPILQPLTREQLQSLYYNAQLANNSAFIDHFVQSEIKKENHEFYEIMLSYLGARKHFLSAEQEVHVLQEQYSQFKDQSWVTVKQSVNAKGPCGDGAMCKTTHMYESVDFDDSHFNNCKKTLTSIRHNLQNQLALYSYSSQLARLQVESYIHNLFMSCPVLRDIPRNAPVQACHKHSSDVQHQVNRLRDCITILFVFHRQPINDTEFVKNTRQWTQRLASALVRVASFDDHLFVLNHILRSPAGVGQWGTSLVQIPAFPLTCEPTSFGSPIVDHILTCLATVLMPIKGRVDFVCLMQKCITPEPGTNQSNNWILVDSDGEEDEDPKNAWMYLHENDVVAILNQLDIPDLFKHVLLVTTKSDGSLSYDCKRTSEPLFLKLLAFCSTFVEILGCGLQTYNMPRYKQLNKRIGRMIRMTVQYVSDHWENFCAQNKGTLSQDQIRRLQLEYNCFFQRCTNTILSAEKLGSWQFMTDMPYSTISKETMWLLLWLLHQGRGQIINRDKIPTEQECRKFIADPESKLQLADVINLLPTSEVIYLLTALANMAQSRKADESDFIEAVTFGLFEICYVCSQTREACSKVGRELLVSVANMHPFILSLLIQGTRDNMENIGAMALYLFIELPFNQWIPCESDISVLKQWLMTSDLTQSQNELARRVLSQLNWGVDKQTNRLFLPYEVHKQIAVLLTEAYGKFITNRNMGFYITESFKQMASAMKQQQTSEQVFNVWAWSIALKLHLHHSSFPSADIGLANAFGGVPELANDNSLLPVLKGLKEKNSMACYMALVISKIGHRDADFVSEGLNHLVVLTENYHYLPALHVLRSLVPLFSNKLQALLQSDKFQKIIQLILGADDSFMKTAKSLWSSEFPGPVTSHFANMIQNQISKTNVNDTGYVREMLTLWTKVLTKQPKWFQDKNTCYVIDQVIQASFCHEDGFRTVQNAFKDAFHAHLKDSQQQGGVSTFVSWVSSGVTCATVPSLCEKLGSVHLFGWLSYMILDMEMKFEEDSKLWSTLRTEISNDPKQGLDQALKKSLMKLKLESAPGIQSLSIYQWSKLAVSMDMDHPLLLPMWQKFFLLFLGRHISQTTMQQRASVGEKFYESSRHSGDIKKMKKRLGETADYHLKYVSDEPEQSDNKGKYFPNRDFHLQLSRMYQTFQLWVQEPMLHDSKLYLPALPQQYQSERLLQLFQNQQETWMEYVDLKRVQHDVSIEAESWDQSLDPEEEHSGRSTQRKSQLSCTERILNRFHHHEEGVDLPALQPLKALVPDISTTILDEKQATLHLLRSDLNNLKEYAKSFHSHVAKHVAVDDDFTKLFPQLFYNKSKQVKVTIECKSLINPLHKCSNPAVVNVNVREKACDEIIQRQVDENRAEYKQLMIEGLSPPPLNVCVAAVHVENAITMLVKLCRMTTDGLRASHYNDIACTLFFLLAEMVNDDVEFYPPTRQFFTACIDLLGREFMEKDPSQTEIILQFSFDSPTMAGLMSPHFVPINSPHTYITMYERLVQKLQQQNPDLVFMLLTKFEIGDWLQTVSPAPIEVKRFVSILASGFYSCGLEPDQKHSMVFEIYCKHMEATLRHNFPQNLNFVLNLLLTGNLYKNHRENLYRQEDTPQKLSSCMLHGFPYLTVLKGDASCRNDCHTYNTNSIFCEMVGFPTPPLCFSLIIDEERQSGGEGNQTILKIQSTAEQKLHPKCWKIVHDLCFTIPKEEQEQTIFVSTTMPTQQVKDSLICVGSFFLQLRMSSMDFGAFGLYPKLSMYVKDITTFMKDLMICFINKILPNIQEMNPAQALDILWQTNTQTFAAWIQPLQTETSPLLPWIQADCEAGKEIVEAFTLVTVHLHKTFSSAIPPYQPDTLTKLWIYFCDNLCGKQTPAHVTCVYIQAFMTLPWEQLKPDTHVLDTMMQLKDVNCPESFDLLAHVVCELNWTDILAFYRQFYGYQEDGASRVLACVLLLLIQCYGDQKHIEIPALEQKTKIAESYDWHPLSSDNYRHANNWFLQTCDPRCVLAERSASLALGLRLLKAASGFSVQSSAVWTTDLSIKRQCYVHSIVQLMCQCTFESEVNMEAISTILINLMTEVETVTGAVTDIRIQNEETLDLVREVFALLNNCNPENNSVSVVMTTILQWLHSSPQSILLLPCVRVASRCLASHKHIVTIVEECIHVYFSGGMDQMFGGWDHVLAAIQIPDLNIEEFLGIALEEGSYLLLYGYIVQKLPLCQQLSDEQVLIGQLLDWTSNAKPVLENEGKMLLLWFKVLELVLRQLDFGCDQRVIAKMLTNMVTSLHLLGEDRASSGLLGAIGLGKRSNLSPLLRICARSLAAMISLQIYSESNLRLQAGHSLANTSLSKQEVNALLSLKTNKQYNSFKGEIQTICDIVQNVNCGLRQTLNLLHHLSSVFYSDKKYLSVIHLYSK